VHQPYLHPSPEPKAALPSPLTRTQGGGWTTLASGKRLPPGIDPGVGDWECQNCGNWNWARRGNCNKCGAPKPR